MIQFIKRVLTAMKEKQVIKEKERVNHELKGDYNITERDGSIYLIAGGNRAVAKLEGTMTISEVIEIINKARNAYLDFNEN